MTIPAAQTLPTEQDDPLEGLTEDELYHLIQEKAPEHKAVVRRFAEHPGASPRVWRALLEAGGPYVELVISTIEAARTDPGIRDRLTESRIPQVLAHLAESADGEDLQALFGRIARLNPDFALGFLEEHPGRARELEPDDLMGLLQSRDPEERERALRLLGPTAGASG